MSWPRILEAVASLMNELWARLDTVIADHGGRVDKHIGDAVMAVWGVTSTRRTIPTAPFALVWPCKKRWSGAGS